MTIVACNALPVPVHGAVTFDAVEWRAEYPQFGTPPSNTQLQLYFDLATLILNAGCGSVVQDATLRQRLLYLLVAHIATLVPLATAQGGGGAALVGGITSATEGTVSVSSSWLGEVSQSMAWFVQTAYGQLFWQLTSPFRSFRYVPAPSCGPIYAGRRGY